MLRSIKTGRGAGRIGGAGNSSGASEGGDDPEGSDFADGVITFIADVYIAIGIDGDSSRGVKCSSDSGAIGQTRAARAGEGRDDAARGDFTDLIISAVCHIEIIPGIDRNPDRRVETGRRTGVIGRARDA